MSGFLNPQSILKNDFSDVGPNDVALVRLESALFFYDAVQPIGLPAPNAEPVGQAIVSGWGSATNASIPNKPFILQYAEVSVLTYDGEFF